LEDDINHGMIDKLVYLLEPTPAFLALTPTATSSTKIKTKRLKGLSRVVILCSLCLPSSPSLCFRLLQLFSLSSLQI
jgi:hypothetical protein